MLRELWSPRGPIDGASRARVRIPSPVPGGVAVHALPLRSVPRLEHDLYRGVAWAHQVRVLRRIATIEVGEFEEVGHVLESLDSERARSFGDGDATEHFESLRVAKCDGQLLDRTAIRGAQNASDSLATRAPPQADNQAMVARMDAIDTSTTSHSAQPNSRIATSRPLPPMTRPVERWTIKGSTWPMTCPPEPRPGRMLDQSPNQEETVDGKEAPQFRRDHPQAA